MSPVHGDESLELFGRKNSFAMMSKIVQCWKRGKLLNRSEVRGQSQEREAGPVGRRAASAARRDEVGRRIRLQRRMDEAFAVGGRQRRFVAPFAVERVRERRRGEGCPGNATLRRKVVWF
jgi:hypothetical protein